MYLCILLINRIEGNKGLEINLLIAIVYNYSLDYSKLFIAAVNSVHSIPEVHLLLVHVQLLANKFFLFPDQIIAILLAMMTMGSMSGNTS